MADSPKAEGRRRRAPRWMRRFRAWTDANSTQLWVTLLVFLFILVYLSPSIFVSILPGRVAVLWSRLGDGTVTDRFYPEGLRVKLPWNLFYVYNIRMQELRNTYNALSKDGLDIAVTITVRYRLIDEGVPTLHKYVGPDYVEVLLIPEIGAFAREEISKYEPDQLYSSKRNVIQKAIARRLKHETPVRFVPGPEQRVFLHVEDAFIESIVLPTVVKNAIDSKLAEEQAFLEYEYRLKREVKEAERKEIEAGGIRRFQDIVSEGISERYLKWRGIDATMALARSPNSKIVIIGAGEDGLPIILGGLDAPPTGTQEQGATAAPVLPIQ